MSVLDEPGESIEELEKQMQSAEEDSAPEPPESQSPP